MKAKGFTLIELIVVIVILGILAATALPRFVNFQGDAALAAVRGVAGGINSGSNINFAARLLSRTVTPQPLSAVGVGGICTAALGGLIQGGLPAGYVIGTSGGSANTCGANGINDCTITNNGVNPAVSAAFVVTCYN